METVIGPLAISTQPVSHTNNASTTATFSVYAVGDGPPSFRWRKDGTNLIDGAFVSGTTTASLTLSNVLGTDAGDYSVVISNASGSVTSLVASLTVIDPVINLQPISQNKNSGESVTLSVVATGTKPLGYQWWKDGGLLVGATQTSLTLINLQGSDAGSYDVVVSNVWGSVTSAVALLSVNLAFPDAFNPGANGIVYSLVLQTDGKILVGGGFTTLGGQGRTNIGRLNADGTVDRSFNPGANNIVYSLAVQPDGKILVGGFFTTLGGQSRYQIGRLSADGTLDTDFNPGADGYVPSLAVQPDRKIVVGGGFRTLGGQSRNFIGRLNADGTLDTSFNPGADYEVFSLAVQPDGKILVGGFFTTLGGQSRNYIGRLNADGTLDTDFNPGADNYVNSVALQADGKILMGGSFTMLGGQSRANIGRLNADGTLDTDFNPGANNIVYSLALQVDGKILVGGNFNTLGGQSRIGIGRLNADGTLDTTFNPGADSQVNSLALQTDGKIMVGGSFAILGGQSRNGIGLLNTTTPASQSLTFDGSTLTWLRGGTSPEVWRTTFEYSPDGNSWSNLGAGSRTPGGWQLAGLSLPANTAFRARGYAVGGNENGSSWFVETSIGSPALDAEPASLTNNATTAAAFSVLAAGNGPFIYQWRKNGTNLADGGSVSGATTASLTLSYVFGGDAGGYSVVVSNAYGSATSLVATLTVIDPLITAQPANQARFAGDSVTFGVTAIGTEPLNYQWRKDGGILSGATQSLLTLTNLQRSDAGNYDVVVSNQYGSLTSTAARLAVVGPVTSIVLFVDGPSTPYETALINLGQSYRVVRDANAFNSALVSADATATLVIIDTASSLGDTNIVVGFLTAGGRAILEPWSANSGAALIGAFGATILGSGGTFVYDWGGSPFVPGMSSPPYSTSYLTYNLQPAADARAVAGYSRIPNGPAAVVVGQLGRTILNGFQLEGAELRGDAVRLAENEIKFLLGLGVSTPPMITTQPQNQSVSARQPPSGPYPRANFLVGAGGSQPLTYQWFFKQTAPVPNATNAFLILPQVQATNAGNYSVVVSNSFGSVTSAVAILKVLSKPVIDFLSPHTTAYVNTPVTFTVATESVSVQDSAALFPPPSFYQWYFNGTRKIIGAINPTLTLTNVQPTNAGQYSVVITNSFGSTTGLVALTVLPNPTLLRVTSTGESNTIRVVFSKAMNPASSGSGALNPANYTVDNGVGVMGAQFGDDHNTVILTLTPLAIDVTYTLMIRDVTDDAMPSNTLDPSPASAIFMRGLAGHFFTDFNSGLPVGTTLYGVSSVDGEGGVGDSGVLRLVNAVSGSYGDLVIDDFSGSNAITAFKASFNLLLGGHSADGYLWPADGFSFNFGTNLPTATSGNFEEDGVGTGLSVCVDTFDNGNEFTAPDAAPAIGIKSGGNTIAFQCMAGGYSFPVRPGPFVMDPATRQPMSLETEPAYGQGPMTNYAEVTIELQANQTLWVTYKGVLVISNLQTRLPVMSGGKFSFAARTGGANENMWFDNLQIDTFAGPRPVSILTADPANQAVPEGCQASFNPGIGGSPPYLIQWFSNNVAIADATNSSYLTPPVKAANNGDVYRIDVSNAVNSTSRSSILTVLPPVFVITQQPQSQAIRSGSNVTFSVSAISCNVPITYQWQFGGVNIPGATATNLTLANVKLTDAGNYRAMVSDSLGSHFSDTATLTVTIRPIVIQPLQNQTAAVGENFSFTVTVTNTATLPINYQWRRQSTVITNMVLNETTSTFLFNNVRASDAALYRVVITNLATPQVGLPDNSAAILTVVTAAVPSVVTQPAFDLSFNKAALSALVNPNGGQTTTFFDYGLNMTYGSKTPPTSIGNGTNSIAVNHVVAGLLPDTIYHFRLVATNIAGMSLGDDQTFSTLAPAITGFTFQANGSFRLQFAGNAGANYDVLVSTDLITWDVLGRAAETAPGAFEFSDGEAPHHETRFYKLRSP